MDLARKFTRAIKIRSAYDHNLEQQDHTFPWHVIYG
jgi:hypothetical protein